MRELLTKYAFTKNEKLCLIISIKMVESHFIKCKIVIKINKKHNEKDKLGNKKVLSNNY